MSPRGSIVLLGSYDLFDQFDASRTHLQRDLACAEQTGIGFDLNNASLKEHAL